MALNIPQELARRTADGSAVLFAGSGLSQPLLPGWRDLLKNMLAWTEEQGIRVEREEIQQAIQEGDLLLAAQALFAAATPGEFHQYLRRVFRSADLRPQKVHYSLSAVPFEAIVTTNYDTLIEAARSDHPPKYTQLDRADLLAWLREPRFAIFKLHGDIDRSDSIVLTQEDYARQKFGSDALRMFLSGVFMTRTVLFLGYSLTDPDLLLLLEHLQYVADQKAMPHYALMKTRGMSRLARDRFQRLYGVRIFGDDERDDFPDVCAVLQELAKQGAGHPEREEKRRVGAVLPVEPVAPASDPRAERLLEAMGHRILNAPAPYFLSQYRAGEQLLQVVIRYVGDAADEGDIEGLANAMKRFGFGEGLLLTEKPLSKDLQTLAEQKGIRAYQRSSYTDRLARFDNYLHELRERYESSGIETYYVEPTISPEFADGQDGADRAKSGPIDAYIDAWLKDERRNHLSILGDFGTGKTWFCMRLADRLAKEGSGRIPILVSLRDYSRAYDIEQLLTDALVNRFGVALPAGFKTFEYLNEEGRLLLIFDGFDEMERRVSDYRSAAENFRQIAKVVTPRSKVILTCRTAFFRHYNEESVLLAGGAEADLAASGGPGRFEIVHLQEFDEQQIREAVRRRAPEHADELLARIAGLPNLRDMVHRPVLLDMVTQTLDAIQDAGALNMATLYETYTERLLKQRISPDVPPISVTERRFFLEELAWEMQRKLMASVPFSEFPERVTRHFGLMDPEKVAYFDRDIRTQSYLIRDRAGQYRFAHKSIMEYFAARKLARLISDGQTAQLRDCPITNSIVTFFHYLTARSSSYDKRLEGAMVYIPAATFVFGWEEQANLGFATVQLPFWIDRFPVTNAQYAAFLNSQRKVDPEWIDLGDSFIHREGDSYTVRSGSEQHPVTGVTWIGARAYATHYGKRLPTEQEWELAARGVDGRRFPWGEGFGVERCNTRRTGLWRTTPVGQYGLAAASPYGAEDMTGNVWEWTETAWGDHRVMRGGSFMDDPMRTACAYRGRELPRNSSVNLGFRCAKSAETGPAQRPAIT